MTNEETFNHHDVLRHAFEAGEGSFLLQVRGMVWDRDALALTERAMVRICQELAGADEIPRWIATGFWYHSDWLRSWTSHPNFPRPEASYYEEALERMHALHWWLLHDEDPGVGRWI